MEHSPRQITGQATKQASVNLRRLKYIKNLFLPQWYAIRNQLQEENWKIHKYVETKYQTTEQPMGQRRNQKRKFFKYLETNENGNTINQNLQDTAKAVLRGKFIVINTYIKKKERGQINNLTLHLKELEKEE